MTIISASIVLYNTDEFQISRVLDCITQSTLFNRIIVIDNSPVRRPSSLLQHDNLSYIHCPQNVGYGAGHNIAIREIINDSEFHLVLNPDIYFETTAIHRMIERLLQDETIGQLMPKVIYPNGDLQYLCKLIPSPFDLFSRRFFQRPLKGLFRSRNEQFELRFTGYSREMDVPFLSGCFMFFRTSALRKVGMFDERFFMYGEDIDITRRMHAQFRTIFFPAAMIFHEHAQASYKSINMLFIHGINLVKYFNKWGWLLDSERKAVNKKILSSLLAEDVR